MRVGLLADTHDEVVGFDGVLPSLRGPFEGVELVVHCGDLTTVAVLDALASIAPVVVAVRSANDPPAAPPRLLDGPHVLDADGTTLGVVCALRDDDRDPVALFGRPVDVVVHGGTHAASVAWRDGVLYVNPGSPTLSDRRTVAVLDTAASPLTATVVEL